MSLPSERALAAEPERRTPEPETDAEVDAEVLVVGAGPVGCWLAAELCAAGVRVLVLEARESRATWSRGFVVHPRTLEIFDSRGAAAALLDAGRRMPTWHFAMGSHRLDFTALPTAFPYILIQPQARTEELLEEHLRQCGGAVLRGRRVVDLDQRPDRVTARVLHNGAERTVTARFVVGCDGARSTVRRAAGIGFSGNPDTIVSPSALVELADPPPPEQYMQTREQGIFFAIPLPDGRFVVSTVDHAVMHEVDATWTAEMVRDSLRRITGTDYGMGEAERVSTLGNSAKQADRYREHRVLLAGDAAHVHFPMGGQGMNLGVQDAHNLAWRLTAAVRAQRAEPATGLPPALLDGYEAERRPAGERVLEDVRAQMALVAATGADGTALRSRFDTLLFEHPEVNLQYARRLSGLDVRYPVPGSEDPRLGARVPDLVLDPATPPAADSAAGAAGAASAAEGSAEDSASRNGAAGRNGTAGQQGQGGQAGQNGHAGRVRLYDLLREIGPGRFVRLTVSGAAAAADAGAGAQAASATAASAGPDGGTSSEDTIGADTFGAEAHVEAAHIAVRSVHGPDWALRAGWGRAEAILIRPDGHVAGISALADAAPTRRGEPVGEAGPAPGR